MEKIIVGGEGLVGNLSNCEIETVKVDTTYKPYKFTYTETY